MALLILMALVIIASIILAWYFILRRKGTPVKNGKPLEVDKLAFNSINMDIYRKYQKRIADSQFHLMHPEDWEWVREFEKRHSKEIANEKTHNSYN